MRLIDADALDRAFTDLRWNKDGTLAHVGDRPDWCLHGYEVDKLIREVPTVGEWVSVKDRLPEKNGDYITYDRDGTVWPHFFTASSKVWEDALGFSTELVTHWMPLPKPPKE